MFAVPGWSLSTTDLKSQKEDSSSKKKETAAAPDAPAEAKDNGKFASQSAKKRKRANDGVTKSNLDEMFRRHIEGHDDSKRNKNKSNKKDKNKNKDNKQNGNNEAQEKKPQATGEPAPAEEGRLSKKQKKNRNQEKSQNGATPKADTVIDDTPAVEAVQLPPPIPPTAAKLTPLQQKMRDKLVSARFRHLNETLYTTPSKQAFEMFDANPELFAEYHAGFSHQVKESWPSNPVDGYITAVRKRGAITPRNDKKNANKNQTMTALPRRPNGACTIADLGCGDAQFARALTPAAKKLQVKLLSYDLQAPDSLVTKADIANLPVTDGTVDIAIFCLSLMGTNWVSFVEEAWRVLRGDGKGECWVSEVKSRFGKVTRKKAQIGLKRADMSNTQKKKLSKKNKKKKNGDGDDIDDDSDEDEEIYAEDAPQNPASGNDDTDISAFVEVFKTRGFVLKQESVDKSNKMFVKMEFVKAGGAPTKGKYAGVTPAPARVEKQAPVQAKKKFIDYRDDESNKGLTAEQEAKVLKPCVYKIR
jgi:ribosomal RNA-processing protein 8